MVSTQLLHAGRTASAAGTSSSRRAPVSPATSFRPAVGGRVPRAAAAIGQQQQQLVSQEGAPAAASAAALDRRQLLAAGAALLSLLPAQQASADEDYSTFLGMASPPTSYGGYGGNANEKPKYSFEYPTGWKAEVPSKVEKGTQGIDGRVVNPRGKDQRAFVITLARAGEDDKSFRLTDIDSTFASFQGADYDLQDAVSEATNITKNEAERGGTRFFDYDIESPSYRYLSSIAVKDGKVFALFVRSPTKAFGAAEAKLRHIVDTFKLL